MLAKFEETYTISGSADSNTDAAVLCIPSQHSGHIVALSFTHPGQAQEPLPFNAVDSQAGVADADCYAVKRLSSYALGLEPVTDCSIKNFTESVMCNGQPSSGAMHVF